MATGNAAANAKNNTTTGTENSKVEGTIVLSDLEKKAITDEATLLFSKVQIGQRATLKDKLELAKFLLKMKRELKNEFYKVITDDIISRKQVGRHIQLILTLKSVDKYTQGMSTKDKKSEKIDENLALLVEDSRVISLTDEQINEMPEATMAAITRAKEAESDDDFIKAINGDKKVLKRLSDKRTAITKKKKEKEKETEAERIASLKPENMSDDKYNSLLNQDKPTLISMFQAQADELKALHDELERLKNSSNKKFSNKALPAISLPEFATEEG